MNSFAQQSISLLEKFVPFEKVKPSLIRPTYSLNLENSLHFDRYINFIETLVKKTLPAYIIEDLLAEVISENAKGELTQFYMSLPRLFWSLGEGPSPTLCATVLVPAELSYGVGRYASDTMCRWLIPGKYLPIVAVQSLNFQFVADEDHSYYFHQMIIPIQEREDFAQIQTNLKLLEKIIPMTIRSVLKARKVMSVQSFSTEEKKQQIEENILDFSDLHSKDFNQSIFEHMQQLFIKLYAEDKASKIKNEFIPLLQNKPKVIDRTIFSKVQNLILLYPEKFIAQRELNYLSRLITTQYLFRKFFENHDGVKVKLFKTQISVQDATKYVLGILVGIKLYKDIQVCDERHIIATIRNYIPHIRPVKDSMIVDQGDGTKQPSLIYLEIEKEDNLSFNSYEIQVLRTHLAHELQTRIQNICHPTFMPRNEEEVMRNIVILSQQLRYVNDLPQVVITFDNQTQDSLSFNVILLRLLHNKSKSFAEILKSCKFACVNFENKIVGYLRKKYPKEAIVFTMLLDKKSFLRKDFSLDLFKARRTVNLELQRLLGEIRDYNGGILSRQHEMFHSLCEEIMLTHRNCEFFLENFFYSLSPSLMQSLLSATVLKKLFLLFLEAIDHNYKKSPVFFFSEDLPETLMIMIASADSNLKKKIFSLISTTNLNTANLTSGFVQLQGISYLGLLYASPTTEERNLLTELLLPIN